VQFAAYNDRPSAEQFAQTLQRRGIAARVEGEVKPFRVRAGRFATREEAEATLLLWTRPGQQGIVVSYP
jgi:cell division protein FtsN